MCSFLIESCEKVTASCEVGVALKHWEAPSVKWPPLALSSSLWCALFAGIMSTRRFGEDIIWVAEENNFQDWKAVAVTCATCSD